MDALIIDTPPGTSDEHITVMEGLRDSATNVTGAVLVTTPQAVAVGDVRLGYTGIQGCLPRLNLMAQCVLLCI